MRKNKVDDSDKSTLSSECKLEPRSFLKIQPGTFSQLKSHGPSSLVVDLKPNRTKIWPRRKTEPNGEEGYLRSCLFEFLPAGERVLQRCAPVTNIGEGSKDDHSLSVGGTDCTNAGRRSSWRHARFPNPASPNIQECLV